MTRMSEERLEAIRGCDQCVWISPGIPPTSCDFDRRDLLAEVDALRAELSAFRRAVLTDGAGGTEEEVTPEALEAELRLLRNRSALLKEAVDLFNWCSLATPDRYEVNLFIRKVEAAP